MNPLADGQWHRMHPATPLLRGGIALVAVLGVIIGNLRERLVDWFVRAPVDAQGDPVDLIVRHGWTLWALLGVLAFIALVIVFYRVSWRATEFRVGGDAVELRSGVLNKQHRQARLDRIQGVNVNRPLFARLFGAARLEIVVAGHDANLTLQYLASAPAEELRREILGLAGSRRRVASAGFETPAAAAPQPAGGGAPVDQILQNRVDEFLTPADLDPDAAPAESVVRVHPGRLIGSILLSTLTLVLAAVIVWLIVEASLGRVYLIVAIVPSLFGMITAYTRRFGRLARYTISGSPDGVRVGYGLLGTSSETIPAGRIHAIELAQPLFWRPFGWWSIRVNRAGRIKQRGQAENAATILPVGSVADVQRVLPLLLPAVDPAALAVLVAATTTRARGTAEDAYFSRPPRTAAWLHPFSWRRTGYAFSGDAVALRRGVVARRLVLVPLARIQSVGIRQGPLHRLLGLATLTVHVVDGIVRPVLPVIGTAAGARLFEQIAHSAVVLARRDGIPRA